MSTLSPKKAFQENEDAMRAFRAIVDNSHFNIAMTQALAEFVVLDRPTTEELDGVRKFLKLLLSMAEVEQPMPHFPVKRMQVISDSRGKPSQPETQRHD